MQCFNDLLGVAYGFAEDIWANWILFLTRNILEWVDVAKQEWTVINKW